MVVASHWDVDDARPSSSFSLHRAIFERQDPVSAPDRSARSFAARTRRWRRAELGSICRARHPLSRRQSCRANGEQHETQPRAMGWTVVAGAALAVSGCESACPRTHLDLTLHGGFGYVLNPDLTVEAGFMKDISTASCDVKQLGIDLKVDDGTIVSPAGSPLSFPVANAVVTIDGLGTGAVALKGVVGSPLAKANASSTTAAMAAAAASGPGGKNQPMPRTADNDWEDLFWVPHTRLNYPDKRIDPDWRTKAVTGRIVLTGACAVRRVPSDGAALNGLWSSARRPGTSRISRPSPIACTTERTS